VGGQRGLGRVQAGILGWGGVGVPTGSVAGDRGVVAERARGVNVACAQEKHLGTDPLCRHILTTVQPSHRLFSRVIGCTGHNGQDRLCVPSPV